MIEISDLVIADRAGRHILDRITLDVAPHERLGVVGESGSGKTTLAHALLGSVRPGLRRIDGSVRLAGYDMVALDGSALRSARRTAVSYLPQDPPSHLTPTIRVAGQITEMLSAGQGDAGRHLARVGLPTDPGFQRRFPHQLSGGQQQRLALARALAAEPAVLILDEPTTGLDAIIQRRVLDLIDELVDEHTLTLLFITHDLSAVARLVDRLVVMRDGRIVEDSPLAQALRAPKHPYTADLLRAVPVMNAAVRSTADRPPGIAPDTRPVLRINDLHASHGRHRSTITSAGISFEVAAAECVALLGLSGTGKTTLARCISGHHRPDRGTVELDGTVLAPTLRSRSTDQRRRIQLIAQDATLSLNPRHTVRASLIRPLRKLRVMSRAEAAREVERLLHLVNLDTDLALRYPSQLSGGQRQRVAIARALAASPEALLCDEVTANLDVRVQAEVLDLLNDLRARLGLSIVFITHDLGVLTRVADRILVLADGIICEQGPAAEILKAPRHAWTRALVAAAPTLAPARHSAGVSAMVHTPGP